MTLYDSLSISLQSIRSSIKRARSGSNLSGFCFFESIDLVDIAKRNYFRNHCCFLLAEFYGDYLTFFIKKLERN